MLTQTQTWLELQQYCREFTPDLKTWLAEDSARVKRCSVSTQHLYLDYSRQLVDARVMELLLQLAHDSGVPEKITAMFKGDKLNLTENRAVLHTALRNFSGQPVRVDGTDVMPEITGVLEQIRRLAHEVRSGVRTGITGKTFRNILAIGIGGSYLGPEFLARACQAYALPGIKLQFIANVDASDLGSKIAGLDAAETLVVIISKTFTTAETMKNAGSVKLWMTRSLGTDPGVVRKHFIAVSTARDKVLEFGIDPGNMFIFWDWVGGRYSSCSAVGGVPLSLYLGYEAFEQILRGAYWMDRHFHDEALDRNIPVLQALIDIWNVNFMGFGSRALLPYAEALSRLPAHTQQVEMESNGKSVDVKGGPLDYQTGEVVFGEPGTNGQHSFYQLLHQGMAVVPADFIGFIEPCPAPPGLEEVFFSHHDELMTNFFAQPDALALGQDNVLGYKNFSGNRPSSSLLLQVLNPFTAGVLLALTEHRAAVKGFVWQVNSFDQFGVELGKKLGVEQRARILQYRETGHEDIRGVNPSTAVMLRSFLAGQLPG